MAPRPLNPALKGKVLWYALTSDAGPQYAGLIVCNTREISTVNGIFLSRPQKPI